MGDNTGIEWTDATVNAINGCTVVSPACTNCYAMKLAGTRLRNHPSREGLTQPSKAGPVWTGEVKFWEPALLQPLRWQRPRKIFWNAHGDMFHPAVPDEWIDRCFAVMALTPQHVHQVLTKRPERMRAYMASIDNGNGERLEGFRSALVEGMAQSIHHEMTGDDTVDQWLAVHLPLPNVWLGTTAEDQERANERIPHLIATPAAVRFVSCEPLLGAIDLRSIQRFPDAPKDFLDVLCGHAWKDHSGLPNPDPSWSYPGRRLEPHSRIHQVILGCESGPHARYTRPEWVQSLVDQCFDAGTAVFVKQLSSNGPGRIKAIKDMALFPESLRIREMPAHA